MANPETTANGNTLPIELLPEGWRLNLLKPFDDIDPAAAWACEIVTTTAIKFLDAHGFGSTPRGAVLAAIEIAKENVNAAP